MKLFFARAEVPPTGWTYRNPRHFAGVEAGVTHVALEPGWDAIRDAYEAAGATMVNPAAAATDAEPEPAPSPEDVAKVLIPEDWAELPFPTQRSLARGLGATGALTKEAAMAVIRNELARRQAPADE